MFCPSSFGHGTCSVSLAMSNATAALYIVNPDLEWVATDLDAPGSTAGAVTLNDPKTQRIHVLNGSAATMLALCDGNRGPQEIALEVQSAFRLERAPLAEVQTFLTDAFRQGLVRPHPDLSTLSPQLTQPRWVAK